MVTTDQPVAPPAPGAPQKREIWQMPWGWPEAVLIQGGVLYVTFLLQYLLNRKTPGLIVPFPLNWILPGAIVLIAITLGMVGRRHAFMRWLSGVPFAVTSIVIYTLLGLVGILIVQYSSDQIALALKLYHSAHPEMISELMRQKLPLDGLLDFGLHKLFSSIPFLVATLMIMLNLSAVVGRRLLTTRPGNFGFMLNHVGLLLVMVGMIAGSAQRISGNVYLLPNQSDMHAYKLNDDNKVVATYPLGGTVHLDNFMVDFYPPNLTMIDITGMMTGHGHQAPIIDSEWAEKGRVFEADGLTCRILEYYPSAQPPTNDGADWQPAPVIGTPAPAVKVEVTKPEGMRTTLWVTTSKPELTYQQTPQGGYERVWISRIVPAQLDATHFLALVYREMPQPKAFHASLTLTEPGKTPVTRMLEVNKPARIGDWWLYQSGYDIDRSGELFTIIEASKDPALPVVYTGLICMVLGALVAFWFTPRRSIAAVTPAAETPEEPTQPVEPAAASDVVEEDNAL